MAKKASAKKTAATPRKRVDKQSAPVKDKNAPEVGDVELLSSTWRRKTTAVGTDKTGKTVVTKAEIKPPTHYGDVSSGIEEESDTRSTAREPKKDNVGPDQRPFPTPAAEKPLSATPRTSERTRNMMEAAEALRPSTPKMRPVAAQGSNTKISRQGRGNPPPPVSIPGSRNTSYSEGRLSPRESRYALALATFDRRNNPSPEHARIEQDLLAKLKQSGAAAEGTPLGSRERIVHETNKINHMTHVNAHGSSIPEGGCSTQGCTGTYEANTNDTLCPGCTANENMRERAQRSYTLDNAAKELGLL